MIATVPTSAPARVRAMSWANRILNDSDVVYLDCETTGLGPDAEIIDVAVLDQDGRVILDSLVCPLRTIPPEASKVHGITERDVQKAPLFADLYLRLAQAIRGKTLVIYNGAYDVGIIRQVCAAHKLADPICGWQCAMLAAAAYFGEPGKVAGEFRWLKLGETCERFGIEPGTHRARADAEACRLVVRAMAEAAP